MKKCVLLMLIVISYGYSFAQFTLITSLYNESEQERVDEYLICLEKNLAHPLIDRLEVFYDVSKDDPVASNNQILQYLQSKQVVIHYINRRPTYQDCFDLANTQYVGKKIIIANADIYFNETLDLLISYDFSNTFLALTRWNILPDGSLEIYMWPHNKQAIGSQDAWFFTAPIIPFDDAAISIGVPHCDGRIAYEAKRAGMRVLNPCLTIQCCHVHASGIRNWHAAPYPHGRATTVAWSTLY